MAASIVLAVMVTCTVLIADVSAQQTVITAPSTVIDTTGDLETREQGSTAWICTVLDVDNPWTAYANIRSYLEGANTEGKDYSDLVLYPVMELFHTTQSRSRLCVYLPSEDHCFPPPPNSANVRAVKQLSTRTYYGIRFWGQASNVRVEYYKQKLLTALNDYYKSADLDVFFVSYFNDHVREVRYDPSPVSTDTARASATTTTAYPATTTRAYPATTTRAYRATTTRAYPATTTRAYPATTTRAYPATTTRATRAYPATTTRAYRATTTRAYRTTTAIRF